MMQELLDGLTKILGPIAILSRDKRELKDTALMSIATALNETYFYYNEIKNGALRNVQRERELATYWSAAAIAIRHFDLELAALCSDKSGFWINPDEYKQGEIKMHHASLDNIRRAFLKLL
ncbi:MAG: hypothetical protein ACO3BD_00320 [Chitinophagaceae bacterium]